MEIIPGIEISCSTEGKMIHILGFGIEPQHSALAPLMEEARQYRENRATMIVGRLQELGFDIQYERVRERAKGIVARPHIAAEVLENPANAAKLREEGIVTKQDFFDKFIGVNGRASPPPDPLSPQSAIGAIHAAGGVAVWSHPTWPATNKDFAWIEKTLHIFMEWGLDGIEVFLYGMKEEVAFLYELAERSAMLKTAGSDFHNVYEDPATNTKYVIGGYPTYGYSIGGIRGALLDAIAKRRAMVATS